MSQLLAALFSVSFCLAPMVQSLDAGIEARIDDCPVYLIWLCG